MIKFDLERALAGDKVITRDGREVTQLVKFDVLSEYPLRGVILRGLCSWTADGYCYATKNSDCDHDLFMAPKKLIGFICVYVNSEGFRYTKSFEEAEMADLYITDYKEVARIDLSQFEEGHGLCE